jgi:hypothetical protein
VLRQGSRDRSAECSCTERQKNGPSAKKIETNTATSKRAYQTQIRNLRVEMLGNPITFVIIATHPAGIVIAGKSSQITLKERQTEARQPIPQLTSGVIIS